MEVVFYRNSFDSGLSQKGKLVEKACQSMIATYISGDIHEIVNVIQKEVTKANCLGNSKAADIRMTWHENCGRLAFFFTPEYRRVIGCLKGIIVENRMNAVDELNKVEL
jgi:hypothetical protein